MLDYDNPQDAKIPRKTTVGWRGEPFSGKGKKTTLNLHLPLANWGVWGVDQDFFIDFFCWQTFDMDSEFMELNISLLGSIGF